MAGAAGKRFNSSAGVSENAAARRVRVLDLRIAGGSVRSIAKALGVGKSQVSRDLQAALTELAKEQHTKADAYRTLLLERHEQNYFRLNGQLTAGHLGAHAQGVRILQEEAKLLGLYAPELFAQTNTAGEDLPPLAELMERFKDARRREADADAE